MEILELDHSNCKTWHIKQSVCSVFPTIIMDKTFWALKQLKSGEMKTNQLQDIFLFMGSQIPVLFLMKLLIVNSHSMSIFIWSVNNIKTEIQSKY